MLQKPGEKLEGYDPEIPANKQTIMFCGVELTATNQVGDDVLWEHASEETNVVPIRPNSPEIPSKIVVGIIIVTREGVIRSVWRLPRREYGQICS